MKAEVWDALDQKIGTALDGYEAYMCCRPLDCGGLTATTERTKQCDGRMRVATDGQLECDICHRRALPEWDAVVDIIDRTGSV